MKINILHKVNYRRLSVLPALLFMFSCNIFSQKGANFLDSLTEKFNQYCSLYPREEIFVHTDRNTYIAGEELWFGVYLFDRQSTRLSPESKIAYFEILNAENKRVAQKIIRLNGGIGPGQIVLSDTLSSGIYNLRVYTNWMKNFMPDNCFRMKLNIYNMLETRRFIVPDNNAEKVISFNSPEKEIAISVHNESSEKLELEIIAKESYLSVNDNRCYLFIETHGVIDYKSEIKLTGNKTVVLIPSVITPGINHITIFNAMGKPVCEHYSFTPALNEGNVMISSDSIVKTRGKLSMGLKFNDGLHESADSVNISVSVAPAGLSASLDIASYMLFASEYGDIPDSLFKSGMDSIPDSFLATLKSNWIDWNVILSDNKQTLKYKREFEYSFLSGSLVNRLTLLPAENQTMFLSIPGKNATFQYSITDVSGNFTFSLPLDDKFRDLIIQPEKNGDSSIIKIESPFFNKYHDNSFSILSKPGLPDFISVSGSNYQVTKIYRADEIILKKDPVAFILVKRRFYGKPDQELLMENYITLPTMQEVFFELIPGISLRKNRRSEYEITVKDPVNNQIHERPPILFVDGVVVSDPVSIVNLDTRVVDKIDAIRTKYLIGDYQFYGFINIITKAGDFNSIALPGYAARLQYRAFEPSKTFSINVNNQTRIPDFRNTLYWNQLPIFTVDNKTTIEFRASDFVSDFEIILHGVSKSGRLISGKKLIKVER